MRTTTYLTFNGIAYVMLCFLFSELYLPQINAQNNNPIKQKLTIETSLNQVLANPLTCYSFDDDDNRLINITIEGSAITNQISLGTSNAVNVEAMVMDLNGKIVYGANANTFGYFNLQTAAFINIGTFGSGTGVSGSKTMSDVDGLTIDPGNGTFYGSHRDGDGGAPGDLLFKFNPTTGLIISNGFGSNAYVVIAPITVSGTTYYDIDDIAIDPISGIMYGIANNGGGISILVTINKSTGATSTVGIIRLSNGNTIDDVEGLAFYNDGTLYATTGTTISSLYTINKSTGVGTKVGDFTIGSDYEAVACLTGGIIRAINNASYGNILGSSVSQNILTNDFYTSNNNAPLPSQVNVDLNPNVAGNQSTLVVSGQGTWSYNSTTGVVTFTPLPGYMADPTPIPYTLIDITTGVSDQALIIVGYVNCQNPASGFNTIIGSVYGDTDMDMNFDNSEPGISGVTVYLRENNNIIQTTTSNANGDYQFGIEGLVFTTNGSIGKTVTNNCDDAKDGKEDEGKLVLGKDKTIGVRFRGITIPAGANITTAFLYFTASNDKNESGSSVEISAHDTGSPVDFCSNDETETRTKTTAKTTWNIPNDWSPNQEYQSSNISSIVNELKNSFTYSNGNMVFLLRGTGNKDKDAYSHDESSSRAPRLVINYTIPGGPYTYTVTTDASTIPSGSTYSTDNIETITFAQSGTIDCDNDFGIILKYDISGTVFDDGNAGTVNGIGFGNPDAIPLYANLVNGSGNVVGVATINNNGTYSIIGVTPGMYTVVLSSTAGVVGNTAPVASLPSGWNNTNEGIGPNSTGDGNQNGSQSITISNANLTNIDFGINDAPLSMDVTKASQVNPGGITQVTAGAPSVTDTEDGTPTTIKITTLPTDGSILYYNGVAVTANQTILNFNPGLLTIDPIDGAVTPTYNYTTTDAAGVESNESTVTMPFTTVSISGTVYDDGNAGTVNGSGLGNPDMTPLYANLVNSSGNVVGVTTVNNNGTYSITGVTPGMYSVVLSTTSGVIGNTAPAASLPSGWNNTNEGIGPNATGDASADGSQSITVPTTGLTNIDFGINDAPLSMDVTEASQVNPGGITQVTAGAPSITDTEDGTPTTIKITTLPTDGSILYYNGVAVTANQTILNFNPGLLTIDPIDGAVTPTYNYTTTDAAGVESNESTVTMPFTTVSISGTVYDDGNAGTVNGSGLGNPDMTPLYANLVNSSGNVVGVTSVNNNGTYSITGVTPGMYSVVLSTTSGVIGNAAPAASLPSGWNNTNEGIGPNATGDASADGSQSITVPTTGLTNIDFGINDAPLSMDVTKASQVNPGGITQVTAGAPSVTDTEDGTPTTIKITTLPTDGSILYYNGVAVTANQTILNFNPGLLTIDPIDGAVTPTYNYTTTDAAGVESNESTVTMPYYVPPVAVNDSDLNNTPGDAVTINILVNDTVGDGMVPTPTEVTVTLNEMSVPGGILNVDGSVSVPGEGTWSYNDGTGELTFTPCSGAGTPDINCTGEFTGDPTPIEYTLIETSTGLSDQAVVTIDYICFVNIKGQVFYDRDGLFDGEVDGTGMIPPGMYAALLNVSGGTPIVEDAVSIPHFQDPNPGVFELTGLPFEDYVVVLVNNLLTKGDPYSPISSTLPPNYGHTGDFVGTGPGGDYNGRDGITTEFTTQCEEIFVKFGIVKAFTFTID